MAQEIMQNIKSMPESQQLYADVCYIIDDTRTRVAVYVNSEVCMTNWRIGTRIKEDVLYNKRAEYGKQVIKNLAAQLTERYGKGWSEKTLRHCLRSAETIHLDSLTINNVYLLTKNLKHYGKLKLFLSLLMVMLLSVG